MSGRHVETGLNQLAVARPGCAVTIGNFDGVHLGHQALVRAARSLVSAGKPVVAVTFDPHPMMVLRPSSAPPRLLTLGLKMAALKAAGAEEVVVLRAVQDVLGLTAEGFLSHLSGLQPAVVVEGKDFVFGRDRTGNGRMLSQWCAARGATFQVVPDVEVGLCDSSVVTVSSTVARWLVARGRVRDAARVLGRAHTLHGVVVKGNQRGRTIGFPTANIDPADQVVPSEGVYAGAAIVPGGSRYPAAVSIGTNPTFGDATVQIEAHLIGFDGDLYGQVVTVEFYEFLRGQQKFYGVEQLQTQLRRDVAKARESGGVIATPVLALC